MQYLLRNFFGGLCLILAGCFSHVELVYTLGLLLGGMFFLQFHRNRWEVLAAICLAMSGPLIILDYQWAPILIPISGAFLLIAQPLQGALPSSRLKQAIGISLVFSELSSLLIIAGLLVCLMSILHFFEYAEELNYQLCLVEYDT